MDVLQIEPSKSTPRIEFDPAKQIFEIAGISKPEDVRSFYYPIMEWLNQLGEKIEEGNVQLTSIELNFKLYYFNSSSAKFLVDIISTLNDFSIPVTINWFYEEEDTDLIDAGKDMSEMVDIEFNYIPVKQLT